MVIFSGDALFAIKVVAAATPVAGLAAFAHVKARKRRAGAKRAERARNILRTVVIDLGAAGPGFVSIELTPHLLACLAAANSARLRGYPTPDSVMMAPAVDATWKVTDERTADVFEAPSKLVITREFVKVRSSPRSIESVRVPLRELLDAHSRTREGVTLYCDADGAIRTTPPVVASHQTLRVGAVRAPKDFYWVRAGAAAKAPESSTDANREI